MKNKLLTLTMLAALAGAHLANGAPMGTAFTYQGRLNDGGQPANNIYDLTFTLHDDQVNAASIGTYIILSAVPVTNGLFTVQLNANGEFGPSAFSGAARWLQIGVRTNGANAFNHFMFLSPRQPLAPAPCALFASNAVTALNASFAANVADGAITASKLAPGAVTWPGITGIPAGFVDGVDNDTTYSAGPGLSLSGANQFSVNFAGAGSANTSARSDHNHFGANWSGNSSGYGLTVVNSSTTGSALYSQQGAGSGAAAPFGYKAAVWGESSQGDAVYGASGSAFGAGVYGYATASSGANYGVYGQSDSTNGVGVFARGSGTAGTALKISNGALRVAGAGNNSPTPAFVHLATTGNLKTNFFNFKGSVIDNPYCNNDSNALLVVTINKRNNFLQSIPAPAVFYDPGAYGFAANRWVLTPTDPTAGHEIPDGAAFNILVIKP